MNFFDEPAYYQLEFLNTFVSHLEKKVLEVSVFVCCPSGSEGKEAVEGCRCLNNGSRVP